MSRLELRSIGPAACSGRIVDLAVVEKDTTTFYAASATGGVWKTTNNGVTFDPVFERESTHSVGDIAVHQIDTDVVWVGTGERANRQSQSWGDGVYRSTDGGETWQHMGLEDTLHIGRIVMHPENSDIVYVAAMGHLWGSNPERGLYKSTDGGSSWERVLYVDEDTGVVDVALDPSDPTILYAATYQRRRLPGRFHGGGPGSGLYKSTDAGATWNELTRDLPSGDKGRIGISIHRRDPRIVYICVEQGSRYSATTSYDEPGAGIYRSEDKGETWRHMSTWNPRPMYASQILVDPSDDQRIYMVNSFSYSDDGGKTFTVPQTAIHGDERIVWVNPKDSRHVLLGTDGGVGISYDRALTWLNLTNLPVSQFFRVSVDMRKPYYVYGGLQDNGSYAGPSATYRAEGILNDDWFKVGGGDGYFTLVNPENQNIVYTEDKYRGPFILDLETRQTRSIQPGSPRGHTSSVRNWDGWLSGSGVLELGNHQAPGNRDAPLLVSPHDAQTLYAGSDELWKSTDGGNGWVSLGNLTTRVDRRELLTMGMPPTETTASLDDGAVFWPGLTAVAESPLEQGLLYVGTDDGLVQVSRDGGQTWEDVTEHLPGLPQPWPWINGIEVSRFHKSTVYVTVNNYRNDDYSNYLYKSTDYGRSWISIAGDLPPNRVLRTLREDPRNPDVLYLGTELGLFVSIDGGGHWAELKNNMPTVAFNDLVIHPRDNDLVLGSHGRGIWILDNIAPLQELTPDILVSEAHLFTVEPVEMIRYTADRPATGDMTFRGANPPAGAIIDYYLREESAEDTISLVIRSSGGDRITEVEATRHAGINRVIWNLRYPNLPVLADTSGRRRRVPEGPLVVPGTYTVELTVGGKNFTKTFEVTEDPRIDVPPGDRRRWTENLVGISDLYREVLPGTEAAADVHRRLRALLEETDRVEDEIVQETRELDRMYTELTSRVRRLYGEVSGWVGDLTRDQKSQWAYYREMKAKLDKRKDTLLNETLPQLNRQLPQEQKIKL